MIQHAQTRTALYERYRHGPTKLANPPPDYVGYMKEFFSGGAIEFIKSEAKRIYAKTIRTRNMKIIIPNKTRIFEHFDSESAIKKWRPRADSDYLNGFSESRVTRSPAGHLLFTGTLDTRLPDDGLAMNAGFVACIGPQAPRDSLFSREEHWNWNGYNSIEVRYRGDGRTYLLVINVGSYWDDQMYYDIFFHPMHTKGGPYWQTRSIPFSHFAFASKSYIQDEQGQMPLHRIKSVNFVCHDNCDGPFALEVDYVGIRNETMPFEEKCAFEHYTHEHIRLRPVQYDCAPPGDV